MQTGFKIRTLLDETFPVVSIAGELTADAEEELSTQYGSIPDDRKTRVIIDFTDTRYINSAGIAALIGIMTRAAEHKHQVEFCSLNLHLKRIIDIVGLAEHVAIHETLDAALQS